MKNKTKKIIENSVFAALSLMLFMGINAFALPGDTVDPVLHKGGGDQSLVGVRLGSSTSTSALIDASQSGKTSVFDGVTAADSRVVGFSSWHQGRVFAGQLTTGLTYPLSFGGGGVAVGTYAADTANTMWTSGTYAGTLNPLLRSLNVLGGISNTSFAAPATTQLNLCVDTLGNITTC